MQTKINNLQQHLQWLEKQQSNFELVQETCRTRTELNEWLDTEEAMWNQRSHLTWLQFGDRNSAFFHARASGRFQRNHINGILDDNQIWQEDESKIEEVFTKYYTDLFTSAHLTDFAEILDAVQPNVSVEMNNMLTSEFQGIEVSQALKQMYPTKAPGPNSMPPLFYQHFWKSVGDCVIKTLLDFLNHGKVPPKFNETHIVLIPKTKNPTKVISSY